MDVGLFGVETEDETESGDSAVMAEIEGWDIA